MRPVHIPPDFCDGELQTVTASENQLNMKRDGEANQQADSLR